MKNQPPAEQRPEAAPEPHLQDLARPALRGQAARCRRPVRPSARARACAELRRKEPDSSAQRHAVWAANEDRPRWHDQAGLQAPRDDHTVRGAKRAGRPRDLDAPTAAPACSVTSVPELELDKYRTAPLTTQVGPDNATSVLGECPKAVASSRLEVAGTVSPRRSPAANLPPDRNASQRQGSATTR